MVFDGTSVSHGFSPWVHGINHSSMGLMSLASDASKSAVSCGLEACGLYFNCPWRPQYSSNSYDPGTEARPRRGRVLFMSPYDMLSIRGREFNSDS